MSAIIIVLTSCRETPIVETHDGLIFSDGLYILNEGNMGSNKATIDFYSLSGDSIIRNIYPMVNPDVVKELGDVGNDIAIYGSKMYIVVNVSGKVEVTDTQCHRITQINIPNCRSIAFSGGYAYVSSYAGPIDQGNPEYKQKGYVAKIDTATLSVVETCLVGYQPNGIAAHDGFLYVANSGGYMAPRYDSTVSVIALDRFEEVKRITVSLNLDAVCLDSRHNALYVSSLGDYYTARPQLYRLNLSTHEVESLGFAAMKMCLVGDELYYYYGDSYSGGAEYGVLNTTTNVRRKIALSNANKIVMPYSIFVDEKTGEIFVTDARDYVTPGVLYRYSKEGTLVSSHRTGDIPGHIVKM